MAEWSFPGNGYGQIRGPRDAGIMTFSGNELEFLARETCQNSLDACAEGKKIVRVEFEKYFINSINIPGYSDYKLVIEKSMSYWMQQNSEDAHKFLKNAKRQIEGKNVFLLRISDYNTKGLLDPYGNSSEGWNSLTKIDGGATKKGDSQGSFGVGKNASFANSYYRLVFYRTLNENMECAAQGMSRMLSFPNDISKPMDTMTIGIGYYGNPDRNMPVKKIEELEWINRRNDIGTDVFIYGFKGGMDWQDEVIAEILDSFLMSIHREQLEVKVQDTNITKDNLDEIIKRYDRVAKNAYCNYRVLSEPGKVSEFVKDFHGMGTLRLRVLIDPVFKLNKKVLVVRKSGMKLFQMGGISRALSFTGILELEGASLNEYFREMETMAHDKWEPKLHSDPKQAKKLYEELKDWVRTMIMDLGENTSDEEVEVEGLSGVLQDNEVVRENQDSDDKKENLNNHLGAIKVRERPEKSKIKGNFYSMGDNDSNNGTTSDVAGNISDVGESLTTRTLKGTRKRKTKEKHYGTPELGGEEIVHKRNGVSVPCNLKNVRVMKLEHSKYRMMFGIPHFVDEGHIEIVTVGENGQSNKLVIERAEAVAACSNVEVHGGVIIFDKMKSDEKVKIDFSLSDSKDYAMEVDVYEHN